MLMVESHNQVREEEKSSAKKLVREDLQNLGQNYFCCAYQMEYPCFIYLHNKLKESLDTVMTDFYIQNEKGK